MSLSDLIFQLFGGEFNGAWSEPRFHEIHPTLNAYNPESSVAKEYKQAGRILSYGDVPNSVGIYLIRDTYKNNIYVGQTKKLGIRRRLSQHLNSSGTKALKEGIMYELRWAETSGERMEKIAEALAVLYFSPSGNISKDWKLNLKRAIQDGLQAQILGEARRLGFLRGKSQEEVEKYTAKIIAASNY
jgi:predicted GIY-YIG superfamily endonuclease